MRDLARGQQIRCKTTECSSWPQPVKRLRLTPSLARSSTEQAWWRGKAGSHIKAGHASLLPLFTFTIQHDTTELHLPQNTPCRSPQTQKNYDWGTSSTIPAISRWEQLQDLSAFLCILVQHMEPQCYKKEKSEITISWILLLAKSLDWHRATEVFFFNTVVN